VDAPWAAVVVNYEAGDALVACVESLRSDTSAGGPPDVVVVDNGSADGSIDALRRVVPDVRVLTGGGNVGYAAAANRGIAATTAAVVAVCNPDVEVRPGTAEAMLAAFRDPAVGAAGPRVRNLDGTTYPSARRDPPLLDALGHALLGRLWPRNPFTRRYRELDADPAAARDVDWASGAALWLRRTAIDDIGGWDEGYFMYMEDVDVGWRLRDAGWRVRYEPAGEVVHHQGLSTARHADRMIAVHHRSLLRFASKRWRGPKRLLLAPAAVFLGARAVAEVAARRLRRAGAAGSRPLGS
jgi:N-acetylglucosaminyl-diphospho-decaprenol L-rhamnosyltransferase